MSTIIHLKNVHENSPKKCQIVSTNIHQKCPQKFTKKMSTRINKTLSMSDQKNSPIMSTRIQPKCPRKFTFLSTRILSPFRKDFNPIVLHTWFSCYVWNGNSFVFSPFQRVNLLPQGGSSGGTPGKVHIF